MSRPLFANDHVSATADLRDTDAVLVTFSNFTDSETRQAIFGESLARSRGFSAIFITARYNHWWQHSDRDLLCRIVRAAAEPYTKRIAYGSSMGAYGALSFGARMGCERIVAIAPQTTISRADVPLRPKWVEEIAKRPIVRDDVPADLGGIVPEVILDPFYDEDRAHVDYLARRVATRQLHYPFGGHKLLKTLHQCGILSESISAILHEGIDAPGLLDAYLRRRETSTWSMLEEGRHAATTGEIGRARTFLEKLQARGDEESLALLAAHIGRLSSGLL